MIIVKTREFEKSRAHLPTKIRDLYLIQEERFTLNPRDPRLHIKKVIDLPGVFSFRITKRYRTFFYLQNVNTAVFFEIKHRKDIYR